MASVEELKDALKEALDRNGSLKKTKAELRARILQALNGDEVASKPELSNENLVINELIREYLVFNGYRETLSVFLPETGQPQVRPFDRSFLMEHLHLVDGPNSRALPMLYSLLGTTQQLGSRPKGAATGDLTDQMQ